MAGSSQVDATPTNAEPTAWWPTAVLDTVESALASARAGQSTTLVVSGEPGTGKTTLLDHVVERAQDFTILLGEGVIGSVSPYAALEQWGVPLPSTTTPFMAAQSLRDRIDGLGRGAAVLLRLDDLQWADPESVDALVWLLRRASGDRLLALVGSRPLTATLQPSWQRWTGTSSRVTSIRLDGLTEDLALRMVRRHHPSLPEATARVLWAHTGGNPLYLSALLTEHDPAELVRMRVLPAPTEFEQLMTDRLDRLDPDAVAVVRAAAVLGTGWSLVPTLASVADVEDILGAADRAETAGLVQVRTAGGALAVRPSHALARSAVYYGTSLRDRRELHLRAAAVADDVGLRLEHRLQASMSFDERLADELADQSQALHAGRSYRLAGQFLEWASSVTADQHLREQRRLDSLFERQLSGQYEAVAEELTSLPEHQDEMRVLLLRGHSALLASQPSTAVRFLQRAVDRTADDGDRLPGARANVLLASAHLHSGASAETVLADLDRARALGPTDPALQFREFYSERVARARAASAVTFLEQLSFLPENVSEVAFEQRDALGWRGVMRLVVGLLPEALMDLREAHERVAAHDAVTDVLDGAQLSFIGVAQWLLGRWDRAGVAFTLLDEIVTRPQAHAQAYGCVLPSTTGDLAVADRRLAQAIETIEREPWQEAVQALFLVRVLRAHAGGDQDERRALLGDTRRRWPHAFVDTGLVGPPWFMHAALAAVWAGELELAEDWTRRLDDPGVRAPWAPAIARWLRGLVAEARGNAAEALALLREAADLPIADLPFYRAHVLTDYARLSELRPELHRETGAAAHARSEAQQIYRQLGALSYLAPSALTPSALTPSSLTPSAPVDGALPLTEGLPPSGLRDRFGLSEREADVAVLVADGMSYAQVARELFITRSTVGFHLGNIYAKVGVTSRHSLHDLVRGLA